MIAEPPKLPPPHKRSRADWTRSLPPAERRAYLQRIAPTEIERAALAYNWRYWARPQQLPPPGRWSTWLILAGRGFGKTRCGAEWVRDQVESGACRRIALAGRTAAEARKIMIEGESGLLAISPPWNKPIYEPSNGLVIWPNGAIGYVLSADEPEGFRGFQYDGAWCDEGAAWRFAQASWDNLQFGLRLGTDPRVVVTTTPRPTPFIKGLLADPMTRPTYGSTYDNAANLAGSFIEKLLAKYEGTRLGLQELHAQLLGDTPGALWTGAMLEDCRVSPVGLPKFRRVVVGVDPSVAEGGEACEAGIVVGGLGEDGLGYVLEDATIAASPREWGERALRAFDDNHADRLVAEINNGGALVETMLRLLRPNVSYRGVHASTGKLARAEPVSALYEQHKVKHVGQFAALESQLTTYVPATARRSPDRLDALVWMLTDLMLDSHAVASLASLGTPPRIPRRF